MNKKIVGVTVATPISPATLKEKMQLQKVVEDAVAQAKADGEFGGADGRSIHFLQFVANSTGDTVIGTIVPQTGGRPFNVGDLGINMNGYLYEYIGDNEWGEHKIQFLARLVKDGENGADGADGKSIFCTTQEKKATESADFHMQFIQTGDRELTVGDLILSSNGWLYRVTSISGTIATASFISILKGEKGDQASVEDVLAALPTVTNITVTEHGDGRFTQVKTFSDGSKEVTEVTVDENGIPIKLTVNGVEIPYFFKVGGDDPVIPDEPEIPDTPTATHYLYGHAAGADETPDVYIGDVGYVGAVLPKLPDWDREMYPYAYIYHITDAGELPEYSDSYWLICLSASAYYFYHTYGGEHSFGGDPYVEKCPALEFSKVKDGCAWVFEAENNNGFVQAWEKPLWTNFDLTLDDYKMKASEPIPVYE